jgi:YD repeat-containing protein
VVVLVILLVGTNLVTLGVLAWFLLRPAEQPAPDEKLARALSAAAGASSSSTGSRRLITIEILNPIELAGTRGRLVGIAGSFAPGITRRLVYDQAMKLVRRHLAAEKVVADVRLHVFRPDEPAARAAQTVQATVVEPDAVDLFKHEDAGPPAGS